MILDTPFEPSLKSLWDTAYQQSSLHVPFYSFDWQKNFFYTIEKPSQSMILSLPELKIVAPFIRSEQTVSFAGGAEISDYMDIVGLEKNKDSAWKEILPYLKTQNISQLSLRNIPESSATVQFFQQQTEYKATIEQEDTTPQFLLPQNHEDYCASLSHKHRHELRRKVRKFEREFPDAEIITNTSLSDDLSTLITLMKLDERKQTFLTTQNEAFFRGLIETFPNEILIQVLRIQGNPSTALLAFTTDHSFMLYNSGFDQEQFPGAGFYLKAKSVRYAIDHGFTTYNFLQGNERYKYELGGKDFGVYRIRVTLT